MVWISNFLTFCDAPIVMFSDGEIADAMDTMRKNIFPHAKNWLLIRRPLDQLQYSSQEYMDYFTNIEKTRPMGITADVLKIWMNKIVFVNEVAEQNPFNTNSFLWCDAGCWRNQGIARQYGPGWPRNPPLSLTMTFMDNSLREIRKLAEPTLTLEECVKRYSPAIFNQASMAGAIFGGSLECIKALHDVFPKVLQFLMESNVFHVIDQEIFALSALWLESQGIPVDFYDKYRQPVPERTDEWFLFQTVL